MQKHLGTLTEYKWRGRSCVYSHWHFAEWTLLLPSWASYLPFSFSHVLSVGWTVILCTLLFWGQTDSYKQNLHQVSQVNISLVYCKCLPHFCLGKRQILVSDCSSWREYSVFSWAVVARRPCLLFGQPLFIHEVESDINDLYDTTDGHTFWQGIIWHCVRCISLGIITLHESLFGKSEGSSILT